MSPPLVVGQPVDGVRVSLPAASTPPPEPAPAPTSVVRAGKLHLRASMEGASLAGAQGFSSTNSSNAATIAVESTAPILGAHSARCAYPGGTVNAFGRGLQEVSSLGVAGAGPGAVIAVGIDCKLDAGFKASNKYIDLMRFDNFDLKPTGTDHLGICIDGRQYDAGQGPGGMRLIIGQVGLNNDRSIGFVATDAQTPEGTTFRLDALFTLSATNGSARSQVWMNDVLKLDTTAANLLPDFASRWDWCRYGIVAINGNLQSTAIGLVIDRCDVATGGLPVL